MKELKTRIDPNNLLAVRAKIERRIALRDNFDREGRSALGYGEPTEYTRRLVVDGLVAIVAEGDHWRGVLTDAGRAERR